MTTLIIDTGQNLVGIYSVDDGCYTPYRGEAIAIALGRIRQADEVVTYCGLDHDFLELSKFAGLTGLYAISGVHTDMRSVIWSDRIRGSSLEATYRKHFSDIPHFPDSHEGSNELDCYMTWKLWELWKMGNLIVIDGHR